MPPDALTAPTTITLWATDSFPSLPSNMSSAGYAVDFGPDGTLLKSSASVWLQAPGDNAVLFWNGTGWEQVSNVSFIGAHDTAVFKMQELGLYLPVLVTDGGVGSNDAGIDASSGSGGSGDAGGGTGPSDAGSGGYGDSGAGGDSGASDACAPPSCVTETIDSTGGFLELTSPVTAELHGSCRCALVSDADHDHDGRELPIGAGRHVLREHAHRLSAGWHQPRGCCEDFARELRGQHRLVAQRRLVGASRGRKLWRQLRHLPDGQPRDIRRRLRRDPRT